MNTKQNMLLLVFLTLSCGLPIKKQRDSSDLSFNLPTSSDPLQMGELAKKGYGRIITSLLKLSENPQDENKKLYDGLKRIIEDTEAKIQAENKLFAESESLHSQNLEEFNNNIRQIKIDIATASSLLSEQLYPSRDSDTRSNGENQKRFEESNMSMKVAEKERVTQRSEFSKKDQDLAYGIEVCIDVIKMLSDLRVQSQEEKSLNVFLQTHKRVFAQLNSKLQSTVGKLRKDFEYKPIVDALTDISMKKVNREVLEKVIELLRELKDSFVQERASLAEEEVANEKNYQKRLESLKNEKEVSAKIVDETTLRLEEIQSKI